MTNEKLQKFFYECIYIHSDTINRYLHLKTRDNEAAEDVLQETFLRAWKNIGDLKDADSARAWVFKIANNEFARYMHKNRHESNRVDFEVFCENEALMAEYASEYEDALDILINNWNSETIREALDMINPNYKEIIILSRIDNVSSKEVEKIMGISASTVRVYLSRGILALKECFMRLEKGEEADATKGK